MWDRVPAVLRYRRPPRRSSRTTRRVTGFMLAVPQFHFVEISMHTSTRVAIACSATLLLAGCAKSDRAASDTAAAVAPAAEPAMAPTLSLADVAGKWEARSVPEAGPDTTPTNYVRTATADTTGWSLTFPSGLNVPLRVRVDGDSVISRSDTYSSPRRKGVKVWTEASWKRQGEKLVGAVIAHYETTRPDSVLRLRSEATRMP